MVLLKSLMVNFLWTDNLVLFTDNIDFASHSSLQLYCIWWSKYFNLFMEKNDIFTRLECNTRQYNFPIM